ncbi:MAG: dicarboxylate/amino acid:cation symporter [Gemmatimonadetes bacterium]|nr:dicarboxylate/amino acid:cation symporter [Gemmatimonadota bacterium]
MTLAVSADSGERRPSLYRRYRRLSMGVKILIWMVAGVAAGLVLGERAAAVEPLGTLFIRLLVMAAIPLVFFNLLAGLTSLSDARTLGRLAAKILIYFTATTVFASILALVVMGLLEPGAGMRLTGEVGESIGKVPRLSEIFLDLFPENVFEAFSSGRVVQVVVFSVLLGVTTLMLPEARRLPLVRAYDLGALLFRKLVDLILLLGPMGIGALAAATVGRHGSEIFGPLALFIGGVWGAEAVMVVVYMILLALLTPYSPARFLVRTGPLWATTAATCSSLASLPVSLELAEDRLRMPRSVYAFTLPLGAQINKDGTSVLLTSVLIFTAQAAGVEFSVIQLVPVVLMAALLSAGSGGIPAGGLVVALIFTQAFGLPGEIAVMIGGVYRLVDMGNTTINVMGDLIGTAIVSESEGLLGPAPLAEGEQQRALPFASPTAG